MSADLAAAIQATAARIGVAPLDLATAISYETAGTFDPWKAGPRTQWGQHRGLIQWGEPQARQYGVTADMPVGAQLEAVGRYLVDRGVKPGMGLLDIYSAINAGAVGKYNASDAHNGGAPGTVRDKVEQQMGGHRVKAERLLAGLGPLNPAIAARAGRPAVQTQAPPPPVTQAPPPPPTATEELAELFAAPMQPVPVPRAAARAAPAPQPSAYALPDMMAVSALQDLEEVSKRLRRPVARRPAIPAGYAVDPALVDVF